MEIVKGSGVIPGVLLAKVNSPADLKKLKEEELEQFCAELRQFIIDIVSVKGGHFGASLGVVELTTALQSFGFTYVTLDLEGYRSGKLNQVLHQLVN